MYKLNGFYRFPIGGRLRELDFRAPEDRLAVEGDGEHTMWSPKIAQRAADYFVFDDAGDRDGVRETLRRLIEETTALNKLSGVPVHAHEPLPPEFIARVFYDGRGFASVDEFVANIDPDARALVNQQLVRHFEDQRMYGRQLGSGPTVRTPEPNGNSRSLLIDDNDEPRDHRSSAHTVLRGLLDARSIASFDELEPEEEDNHWVARASTDGTRRDAASSYIQLQSAFGGQPQPAKKKRIVKPYRRYQPPGMGSDDPELAAAEALADDADVFIRKTLAAIASNPALAQDNHPLMRQFLAAMRRYYAEDGDRAVAAVGTRLKEANISITGRYAGYDLRTDRIYFAANFLGASNAEKIITIIHEALHATQWMKNVAAQSGYFQSPVGSAAFRKHEAYVDNIAKAIAKKLGLIPQNYPPTNW